MRVVVIVQARMGSTRLPGKVLADIDGAPMIDRVVARAQAAALVGDLWIATTDRPEDVQLVDHCRKLGIPVFRGSATDVLGRYRGAAAAAQAEIVVRVTGDCPLLDPEVVDRVVDRLIGSRPMADYAANVLSRSYPRGLDVEAFTVEGLARMDALGQSPGSREHVTLGPRLEHPEAFVVRGIEAETDDSDLRWTVDTPADLEFVRLAYRALGLARRRVPYRELVRWCRANEETTRRDDEAGTWDPTRSAVIARPETEP